MLRRTQRQGTLLVVVGQPPVAQFYGLSFLVTTPAEQVTARVVVQGLSRSLLGDGRRYARHQLAVKRFEEECGAGNQQAGTHGYHRVNPTLDQACRHAAESIVGCSESALACIQHCQSYPAVLQHLRHVVCLHEIKLALVILEGQHALWLAAQLRFSLPILLLAKDAMSIEVQHLHRWQLCIAQARAQRAQGRGPQEFERDGPGLDLALHLVEQFAGRAARVDEARVIGPRRDH